MRPSRSGDETNQTPQAEDERLRTGSTEEGVRKKWWRRHLPEVLGVARCPCCRAELVVRQGRAGPYFACRCPVPRRGKANG